MLFSYSISFETNRIRREQLLDLSRVCSCSDTMDTPPNGTDNIDCALAPYCGLCV